MFSIDVDPSVQLAWSIANLEACRTGSQLIEPVHFLVGLLKVVDVGFVNDASQNGVPPHVLDAVIPVAEECRRRLAISDDEIKRARRSLRNALVGQTVSASLTTLHRSAASKALFKRAGKRAVIAGADDLSLTHLLDE